MTTLKKTTLAMLAIAFAFNACTIEKRKHLAGYHMEWNRSAKTAVKTPHIQQTKVIEQMQLSNPAEHNYNLKTQANPVDKNLTASIGKTHVTSSQKQKMPFVLVNVKSKAEKEMPATVTKAESTSADKLSVASTVQSKTKKVSTAIYKLLALFGIGILIQKLNKRIKQNNLSSSPEKKKKNIGLLILMIVLLVVAMALALSSLLAV